MLKLMNEDMRILRELREWLRVYGRPKVCAVPNGRVATAVDNALLVLESMTTVTSGLEDSGLTLADVRQALWTDGSRFFISQEMAKRLWAATASDTASPKVAFAEQGEPVPHSDIVDGRSAVLRMRDELTQLASCFLQMQAFRAAYCAAELAERLHTFEAQHAITGTVWPAQIVTEADGSKELAMHADYHSGIEPQDDGS